MDNNQEKDYRVFCPDGRSYVITSRHGDRPVHEFLTTSEQRQRNKVRAVGLAMAKAMNVTVTEMQVEVALASMAESGHTLFGARIYPRERFMPVRPDGEITIEDARELGRRMLASYDGDRLPEDAGFSLRPEDVIPASQFIHTDPEVSGYVDRPKARLDVMTELFKEGVKVVGVPDLSALRLRLPESLTDEENVSLSPQTRGYLSRHLRRAIDPAVEPNFEFQVSAARRQMAERGTLPWLQDPIVLTGMEGAIRGTVKPGDEFYARKVALGYVPTDEAGKPMDLKEFMESEEGKRILGDATLRAFPLAVSPLPRMGYMNLMRNGDPGDSDELNAFLLGDVASTMRSLRIHTAKAPIRAGYLTQDRARSALDKVRHLSSPADLEKFDDNLGIVMGMCHFLLGKIEGRGETENDYTACIGPVSERAKKCGYAWFRPAYVALATAMIRNNKGLFQLHPGIKSEDNLAPIVVNRTTLRDFPVDYIYACIASLFFCEEIHTANPEMRHTDAWWDKVVERIFTHICAIDNGAISDEGQRYWRNMIKDETFWFRQKEGVFAVQDQETRQTQARQRASRPFSDRQLKEPRVWVYNWVWSMVHFVPTAGHEMYEVDKQSDKFWNWLERRAEVRYEEKMAATAPLYKFTPAQIAEYAPKFKEAIAIVLPEARKKLAENKE